MPAPCLAVVLGRPWAEQESGTVLRRRALLNGLRAEGPLDVWSLVATPQANPPVATRPSRELVVRPRRNDRWTRLAWMTTGRTRLPYELDRFELADRGTISAFTDEAGRYGSVWFVDKIAAHALWPIIASGGVPTVVDFDDLEAVKLRQSLTIDDWTDAQGSRRRAFVARNAAAWDRWTSRVATSATCSLVAKPSDAASVAARVAVIPNGCSIPRCPPTRSTDPASARVAFVAEMRYPPNVDAATVLVREIAPRLRAALDVPLELRLIGATTPAVDSLRSEPGVTFTGYVDDVGAELRTVDVVAVPIRVGSGTRLKVLEAWAHRVPVVSTSVGCEGLGAIDGEHLLVADDPDAFAAACARLMRDAALRDRLVERAAEHVRQFDWSEVEREVATLRATLERA